MEDFRPLTFSKGVNLLSDPLRINDEEAVRLKNLYPNSDGKLAVRKGANHSWFWQRAVSPDGNTQTMDRPANLWLPKWASNAAIILSHNLGNNELMGVVGLIGDSPLINSVSKRLCETIESSYRPMMVDYGQRTLIALGKCMADGTCIWECSLNAMGTFQFVASPLRFTGPSGQKVAPKVIFVYQDRMVYANFGAGLENVMIFADPDDQPYKVNAGTGGASNLVNVGDTGGRSLRLTGMGGDAIVAGTEISVSSIGSLDEQASFILGSETAIIMPGTPLVTDDVPATRERYSGTLAPRNVNYPCGCVSPDTLVKTPMGLIWASWNDVWAMDVGGVPRPVGTKIRPALSGGDPNSRYLWHAAYQHDTGSYRLAVVSADQATDPIGGFTYPCKDQWWLDVRFGIPQNSGEARWYGPQQYLMQEASDLAPLFPGTYIMRTERRANATSKLYGVHLADRSPVGASPSLNSSTFNVLVEFDVQTGRDNATPAVGSIAGTILIEILFSQQLGNEIVFDILTKEFDFGNPNVDKVFLSLDMQLWTNDVMTLEAIGLADGGRDRKVMNINIDQMGFVGSVDPIGLARVTHQYQSVRLQCDNGERLTGKVLQFQIKNALTGGSGFDNIVGWPVPDNGLNSVVIFKDLNDNTFTIPIPPGFYGTRAAFITALKTAIEASGVVGTITIVEDAVTYPTLHPLVATSSGARWKWVKNMATPTLVSDSSSEADKNERRSRKVASLLGFYETPDALNNPTLVAANNVPLTIATHAELASGRVNVYHFQRPPSGGKYEPNIP